MYCTSVVACSLNALLPLSCSLNVNLSTSLPSSPSPSTKPRIAYHIATAYQIACYCDMVTTHLPAFPDVIRDCCDPLCTQHHQVLDDFSAQLNQCLHDSALLSLPKVNRSSAIPGWNIHERWFKEMANFWNDIWHQAGCPSRGVLH